MKHTTKHNDNQSLWPHRVSLTWHYSDVIMSAIASQITSISIVYCWFRCRSKKTSKLHVKGRCAGNSSVTGEFPTQRASNTENVSIWWHHEMKDRWHVLWNYPEVNVIRPDWWLVNIGSGNGLVPSGNKPLPGPVLTKSPLPYGINGLTHLSSYQDGNNITDGNSKCIFDNI